MTLLVEAYWCLYHRTGSPHNHERRTHDYRAMVHRQKEGKDWQLVTESGEPTGIRIMLGASALQGVTS